MRGLCKAKCLACGATITLDVNGDWHCPVCGAYDGNGLIEWLDEEVADDGREIDLYQN